MGAPEIIAGRYRVERPIGQGGMGTVWLCTDEVLGREVAVKQVGLMPGESAPDAGHDLAATAPIDPLEVEADDDDLDIPEFLR